MNLAVFQAQMLGHIDNVSPADSGYTDRLVRFDEWALEIGEDLTRRKNWPWKRKVTGPITVTSTLAYVALPADYGTMGTEGGVFLSTGDRLDPVSEEKLQNMRRAQGGATGNPEVYSIFGIDGATPYTLQFPPLAGDISVYIDYEVAPPATTTALLATFPAQYHQSVLVPFMRAKIYDSKGDERAEKWEQRAEKAYRQMAITERRMKELPRGMRSFFGSASRWSASR